MPYEDLFERLDEHQATVVDVHGLLEVFLKWAPLHAELSRRLQNGNPVGAFGEVLVAQALGGTLLVQSVGHDVVLPDGRNVEVKTRLWTGKVSDNEFGAVSCPIDTADWPFDLAAFVQIDLETMRPRVAFTLPASAIPAPKYNGAGARRMWGTKIFANRDYPQKVDLLPELLELFPAVPGRPSEATATDIGGPTQAAELDGAQQPSTSYNHPVARSTYDLVSELRRMRPSSDDIERCVDWLRSKGLVGAGDARSRLARALVEDPATWTDGVAANVRKAIRDFIEYRTGERPR